MVRANVQRGSGNIALGSAMSRDGAVRAIEVGIAVACGLARAGVRLLAAGEMGIGNTTTSAAVAAVLIQADARSFVGRGAGLSDASLARKRDVVERAIDANSPDPADPIDVLSKVGGFDIAAMCGFYLGAAASKAPTLLDGVISCTAALCAARLCPNALGYLVGTHASSEPASQELLRELGIKAPLDAGMHLGEGAGDGVSAPSGFGAARVPGWEDVHGDWHGCLRAFRGRKMTVTLVIGAAASGKSAYAESLCLGHDGLRVYLATMELFGEEGARRIARIGRCARARGFPPSSARVTWAPQCPGFRAAARFFWRTWATWLQTSFSRKAACPHVTRRCGARGARRH